MALFLLVAFTIYTSVHLLAIWGCYPLLRGHGMLPLLAGLWALSMVLAPLAARLLDNVGHELVARGVAWAAYCWMGFVFYVFCFSAVLALWQLGIKITGLFVLTEPWSIYGFQTALGIVLLSLAISTYGLYEARNLRVEAVNIRTDRLPVGMESLKIVQISDLHLGLLRREEALGQVISRIEQLKPDLLLATGDTVDAQISHLAQLTALWQQIQPPLGKYAVTGNHEVYAGLPQSLDFLSASGFKVLRNTSVDVVPGISLAGIDDPARSRVPVDESEVLRTLPTEGLRIFLKHRPRVLDHSLGLFDLQLSGHSHRGQMIPFNLLTGLEFPQQDGFYSLKKGSFLYTSRGTGTWGPPMRVGSPPEITLITFERGDEQ